MNKGYRMKFSDNLQNLRKQHNISQEQLAEQINVSRQSISKWESGDSYPETEKLIALCEIFDCKLDDLVRGEVQSAATKSEITGQTTILRQYDQLMNHFSTGVSIGVGIILLGTTALLGIMGLKAFGRNTVAYYDTLGLVALLCSVAIGVPFFIFNAMKLANFKLKHPQIDARYPEDEIDQFNSKFITGIVMGIVILILGIATMILVQDMDIFPAADTTLPPAILLAFATIAVPILVFVGIRRGKYNLAEYNKPQTHANHKNEILIGKICGVIMLSATIIFCLLGFLGQLWEICWIVFPIGGILCGIVGTILGPDAEA